VAATPSIKILKTLSYRGETKTVSNRYHFNGGVPADLSHFTTFANAVTAAEKLTVTSAVTITGAVMYPAGSDLPEFSVSYSLAGTASIASTQIAPGDCVALVRWSTAARSAKNHPIYLFSYMHGPLITEGTLGGGLDTNQKALFETYAGAWITGFSDGTNTYVRAGPNGATATGHQVNTYIRHRDLVF